ncbi:hypothetical protein LO772_00620 [Yinghuangia sp. ASG 101]|uniref:hypothetical protein n=1 Tax=Yinghuangia sp. ASG 101 TaxID=2896848 RepID=UPI001E620A9C|nr:hypothetical protein [Yinghuangia sp. ASG 101]UGQ12147.1 hypothetical protein LO772_00620 [Yinghuangia sp. ASG 101]
MTTVRKHVFQLTPWPWRTLAWVRVPDGLEFTLYEISPHMGRQLRIPATADEAARWQHAYETFDAELRDAHSTVRWDHGVRTRAGLMVDSRAVRLRRYDLVPGRRKRSRAAWARCEARMRAADTAYRPVRDEVERRLAQTPPDPGQ